MKIARRSNDNMTLVSEALHNQNHGGSHKAALNEKPTPTLCNDSSFAVQFSNSVSKTRAVLLFMTKIIEMFELHYTQACHRCDPINMRKNFRQKFFIIAFEVRERNP